MINRGSSRLLFGIGRGRIKTPAYPNNTNFPIRLWYSPMFELLPLHLLKFILLPPNLILAYRY
jgi:hypothetical protein